MMIRYPRIFLLHSLDEDVEYDQWFTLIIITEAMILYECNSNDTGVYFLTRYNVLCSDVAVGTAPHITFLPTGVNHDLIYIYLQFIAYNTVDKPREAYLRTLTAHVALAAESVVIVFTMFPNTFRLLISGLRHTIKIYLCSKHILCT